MFKMGVASHYPGIPNPRRCVLLDSTLQRGKGTVAGELGHQAPRKAQCWLAGDRGQSLPSQVTYFFTHETGVSWMVSSLPSISDFREVPLSPKIHLLRREAKAETGADADEPVV